MPFYDREAELAFFREHFDRPGAGMVVLYGRRRVGKTELLREFARARRTVFYVAEMGSVADQLASFSSQAFEALGESALSGTVFPKWEAALRFLAQRGAKERLLVVLDEFPYLVDSDPALPSILQRAWDAALKRSRIFLVLCGSSVGVMEREILGARNPLYGRRTGQWRLEPLGPREAGLFFPGLPADGRIEAWAVAGGVPAYLEVFARGRTTRENVTRGVLARGAPLFDEVRFLLLQELRDPRTYFSLLRAMAAGNTRPNEIAQAAGLGDRGVASRYLETLRVLQLVERAYPVTEVRPEKSRKGQYRIADPFVRFWFRFVLPNKSALEAGEADVVYDRKIAPALDDFVAPAFEEVARRFVRRPPRPSPFPVVYDRVGAWWDREAEVDVVAVGPEGEVLLGECKWSRRPAGEDVLEDLRARAPRVLAALRAKGKTRVRFALFARAGFVPSLSKESRGGDLLLFEPKDLVG
jgi:hypothetical protein